MEKKKKKILLDGEVHTVSTRYVSYHHTFQYSPVCTLVVEMMYVDVEYIQYYSKMPLTVSVHNDCLLSILAPRESTTKNGRKQTVFSSEHLKKK